ncbi:hypothetical protein Tco_0652438 [Tanacetum coccineum]|uniref:Uncharacterized protein n=1 Tax=Tanacetum coccineum TaxID=301880 RepID=A0ABQ4WXJ9_9ASTR
MRIGNGEKASVMYDNWCGAGILQSFITHRDMYNVRWNDNMVVKYIVDNNIYMWLEESIAKYPSLSMNNRIDLNNDKVDMISWRSKGGKDGKFTIKQAYHDLCSNDEYNTLFTAVMSADSAVTYTSVYFEARSWSILSEDPYEEAARQLLEQAPHSPEYVPDLIELEDHVPVYIPEPEHPEDLVPAKDEAPTPLLPPSFLSHVFDP